MEAPKKAAAPPPFYVQFAPSLTAGSALVFLVGGTYVGLRTGFKRAAEAAARDAAAAAANGAPADPSVHAALKPASGGTTTLDRAAAFSFQLPNDRLNAGQLASKALLYGTILCLSTFTLLSVGVAWSLDTWTLEAFARRMEREGRKGRAAMESVLMPSLEAVNSSSQTLGTAVRGVVPAVEGVTAHEEEAGLSPRDKRLLAQFRTAFEEDDASRAAAKLQKGSAGPKMT